LGNPSSVTLSVISASVIPRRYCFWSICCNFIRLKLFIFKCIV